MTAKVILSMDGLVLKEIPITKERMTVGRRPTNDIQIDNLAISGQHAAILTILNDSFLEDMNSTNGTYVNGQLIKKHVLQNNDIIELGKYRLKFINETPAGKSEDFEKTMVLRPDIMRKTKEQVTATAAQISADRAKANMMAPLSVSPSAAPMMPSKGSPATPPSAATKPSSSAAPTPPLKPTVVTPAPVMATRPAPAAPTVAAKPAVGVDTATVSRAPVGSNSITMGIVQVLSGSSAGRELELSKNVTTIGKPGVQVAVIAKRSQGYFITHVEGAKTPLINGQPTEHSHKLANHDLIEVAGVKMEFYLKEDA